MNNISNAIASTIDTMMYIPLIFFCFLPVMHKIKDCLSALIMKIILAVLVVESIIFSIYLFFPPSYANEFNTILCMVIYLWLYLHMVNIKRTRLLFIFMTACLIGGFGFLIYHIVELIVHPTNTLDISYNQPYSLLPLLFQLIFESILVLLLAYPTKKYFGWLISNFHKERIWQIIWVFPMIFTLVFHYFIPYDNSKMYIGRALNLYITSVIIFVVIIIALYAMFYLIAHNLVENERMTERTMYLKMESKQYRLLQNHIKDTNRIKHDLRHLLTTLLKMLEHQEYEEAKEFLKAYHLPASTTTKQYCASVAINAIINHYASLCQDENINTRFSIHLDDQLHMNEIDFCVLLGNLLENAVYGCCTLKNEVRKIEMKIGITSPNIIALTICNPYDEAIQKDGDRILSSRHKGEGQGLQSVSMIAEKYNGFMKIEYSKDQFLVKVLLKTCPKD